MIGPPDEEIEAKIESNEIRPLILDLHSEHRGYTVTLPGRNCIDFHTRFFTYEDDYEFLRFVENNELPSILTDLIETFCLGTVFYKGCVAIRVRDYRNPKPEHQTIDEPEHRLTILRPTVQSLTDDLNRLLYEESTNLSIDQKNSLESDFWKMISKNLCFEKSIESITTIEPSLANFYERKRKRRAETDIMLENEFKSIKFIRSQDSAKLLNSQSTVIPAKPSSASVTGQWKPMLPSARTPMEIAEKRLSAINEIKPDDQRTVVEEYLIEFTTTPTTADVSARCFKTKIVISRRNSDWIYTGDLVVERVDGGVDSQVRSNFVLGSEWQSQLYIRQYLDMVSEGGRRSLTMTRTVPGKPPQVIPIFAFISFESIQKRF